MYSINKCGGVYHLNQFQNLVISSPNYPCQYNKSVVCNYYVQVRHKLIFFLSIFIFYFCIQKKIQLLVAAKYHNKYGNY